MEKVLQQLAGEIAVLRREVNRLKLMELPYVTVWTDWTPTVTQSGAVTVTVSYAKYTIIQNTVVAACHLVVTGTGSAGTAIIVTGIPTIAHPSFGTTSNTVLGNGLILDSGTARYTGALVPAAAGVNFWAIQAHNTAAAGIGESPSFALASGDQISMKAVYEAT